MRAKERPEAAPGDRKGPPELQCKHWDPGTLDASCDPWLSFRQSNNQVAISHSWAAYRRSMAFGDSETPRALKR